MSGEEALRRMKEVEKLLDTEMEHIEADRILCEVLKDIGYTELVEEYDKIFKWHA